MSMKMILIRCTYTYYTTLGPILTTSPCGYSPLAMKFRSRSGSVGRSGTNTPGGGGGFKSLSEGDLRKANTALKLSQVNGEGEEEREEGVETEREGKGEEKGEEKREEKGEGKGEGKGEEKGEGKGEEKGEGKEEESNK